MKRGIHFKTWCKNQPFQNDLAGHFCHDAKQDDNFPTGYPSLKTVVQYLKSLNACDGAVKGAVAAYREYARDKR